LAAPSSGSGKTLISSGLMAVLTRKGLCVQPYKCGPDYIDTKFHAAVCQRPSINLDGFLASAPHVQTLYARYASQADVCIVEGMMGLFDGYDRDRGSSAEIAGLLGLPVVLVVDAKSAAYSLAPLLYGFLHFRPQTKIAGVLFNRVGSPQHYERLQEVCTDLALPCFGYLPYQEAFKQGSRYLGLDFRQAADLARLDALTDLLEQHVDVDLLLARTLHPRPVLTETMPAAASGKPLRIAVGRNSDAFSFVYEEHLALLHRLGTVTFFDPEHNETPFAPDIDLLYLPGGYPENHAEALANALQVKAAIRAYVEAGGRVLAECGGMMYLSQGWQAAGTFHEMAGVLPFAIATEKSQRRLSLGYRQFTLGGQALRGHEFHYTQLEAHTALSSAAQVHDAKGRDVGTPVFRYKNVIASYTHLYWGEMNLMKLFE
ncbi:MAG: cobyrinate a,c-diamide synthase, partial [Bacteroides sp.]